MRTNKFMSSLFRSKCAETGKFIAKGEDIFYDATQRAAYCKEANRFKVEKEKEQAQSECDNTRAYVQAQEEAYCDNRYNGGR